MIEVIPAVIPQTLDDVRDRLSRIVDIVPKAQIDIVDGKYADTKTWPFVSKEQGDELLRIARHEEKFPYSDLLDLEIDLLILHPIEYIPDLIELGFKSFVIHIDSTDHVLECIQTVKNSNKSIGLGIRPSVDTKLLDPFITDIDFVQFMGNDKVGHNGVELDLNVLDKIKDFHNDHPSIPLQIDIGVNFETAPKLIEVGITRLISGSTIFNSVDIKESIARLVNS